LIRDAHASEVILESLQGEIRGLKETIVALQSTVHSQTEVLQKQSVRINALERSEVAPKETTAPTGAPKMAALGQGFNPDIGVIGTVQAQLTENSEDAKGQDTIALKELEFSYSQYVDPYSRLDAILTFNDNLEEQNVDIEEAYYTHWGLPFGFLGQIGKFRAKVGKQNLLHLHQLDTVDYPLVIRNFFGEEGLASSGARLQNWIPNPWDLPLEVTGEVLRGNNGESFSGISRRPIFNTHLKGFFGLTPNMNLEVGGTVMFGDENPAVLDSDGNPVTRVEGQDRYGVHVFGGDATLIWNLPEGRVFKFQNEVYFQDRGSNSSIQDRVNHDPWGFYSLADLRVSSRWSVGVRFDYLEPLEISDFHGRSTAISPYLTFWQSEYASFRLQYTHTDSADAGEKSDDAIFLEANFLIGQHRHPVQ
jgi:hypothetical protein